MYGKKQSRKKEKKRKETRARKYSLDRIGLRLLQSPELQGALPFWGPRIAESSF